MRRAELERMVWRRGQERRSDAGSIDSRYRHGAQSLRDAGFGVGERIRRDGPRNRFDAGAFSIPARACGERGRWMVLAGSVSIFDGLYGGVRRWGDGVSFVGGGRGSL